MPIQAHNVSRQRSTKSAITINGLLTWRARRLRCIRLKEGDEAQHLADIAAMDHVLVNVLGFTGDIAEASRDFRREAIFGRGELRRAVLTVLREANGPLTARQITERVMSRKGYVMRPGPVSKEWIARVRVVCRKLPLVETREDGVMAWSKSQPNQR